MLNTSFLQYIQASGISNELADSDVVLYDAYKRMLQTHLHKNNKGASMDNWSDEQRKEHKEDLITRFVMDNPRKVKGYYVDGTINVQQLIHDIRRDIVYEGILTEALEDEDINEIQINHWNGAIFIERKGMYIPYIDKEGKRYRFNSETELETLINAMVDNGKDGNALQATRGAALINTKTARNYYRVSITHSSVNTKDLPPYDQGTLTVTIRKFKKDVLRLEDLVRSQAMSHDMAVFSSYSGAADSKILTVGATSSGKTTLLGILARGIPDNIRVILCQNPTEIVLTKRNADGEVVNNALHWEARIPGDDEVITSQYPTLSNLITHALRNSPQLLIIGEMREPQEFRETIRASTTGHIFMSSMHADDAEEALERVVSELSADAGSVSDSSLRRKVASSIDLIFTQKRLADGKRKVMAITEVLGKIDSEGYIATNVLYEFQLSGEAEFDEDGKVKSIEGTHKRVNGLSKRGLTKFYSAGFTQEELHLFIGDPDPAKPRTEYYTCIDGEFDLQAKRKLRAQMKREASLVQEEATT